MIRRPPRSTLFPTRRSSDLLLLAVIRKRLSGNLSPAQPAAVGERRHKNRVHRALLLKYIQHRLDSFIRSEEHTSELQSQSNLVCRPLLEKKNKSHSIVCTSL